MLATGSGAASPGQLVMAASAGGPIEPSPGCAASFRWAASPMSTLRPQGEARGRLPLQVLTVLLLALLVWVLRPVFAALLIGGLIVLLTYPLFERLDALLGHRRKLAGTTATLLVFVTLVVP